MDGPKVPLFPGVKPSPQSLRDVMDEHERATFVRIARALGLRAHVERRYAESRFYGDVALLIQGRRN